MAIKSRVDLKASFTKGKRPKEQEFWDWQESYYHKVEDPIKVGGWQFRSFFKDLRAEGLTILNGGLAVVDIPLGVTRLKRIRVFGKGTITAPALSFTITVSLQYYSDKLIPSLNGVPSPGNPFPSTFFAHPLLGLGTVPPLNFTIVSATPAFDSIVDFTAIPKDLFLDFIAVRFFRLGITIATGTFPNTAGDPSYVYYGLEYE